MRKGQIPIPYIIALILGIAVVAILGYWFFVLGGRIPGQATESWCNVKKNQYCSEWAATGYDTNREPGDGWDNYAPGCTKIGITATEPECRSLVGTKKSLDMRCAGNWECASNCCNTTGYCRPTNEC